MNNILVADGTHTSRLERGISPPMRLAVTIPLKINGRDSGVCVYLASNAFAMPQPDPFIFMNVAHQIVDAINAAAIVVRQV